MQEKALINRWTIKATEWIPRDWTRKQGHPKRRWKDDLTGQIAPLWSRLAKHCRHRSVGSTQGGVPLSRVNTNPNDDDDDEKG